jgi:hypothetical protein
MRTAFNRLISEVRCLLRRAPAVSASKAAETSTGDPREAARQKSILDARRAMESIERRDSERLRSRLDAASALIADLKREIELTEAADATAARAEAEVTAAGAALDEHVRTAIRRCAVSGADAANAFVSSFLRNAPKPGAHSKENPC